jgi:hypothetical protein
MVLTLGAGLALGALGLGGSALGGIFGKQSQDSANAANQDALNRAMIRLQEGLAKGEGAHMKGIEALKKGFGQAQGALAGQGGAARARILQRESQMLGASDAQMSNRGLYSSTRAMGQRRAVHDQTNLALAGVDEGVGAQSASLYQNQGVAMSRAYQSLAGMYGGYAGLQAKTEMANTHVASSVGPQVASMMGNLSKMLMWNLSQPGADGGAGGYGPLQSDGSF